MAGDDELRREVTEPLAASNEATAAVSAAATPARALSAGARLGPYEVLHLLGAGGMGEVYRARDSRLGRDVAVKVLPEHLQHHASARGRFEREARAVAALSHPNILALHDVGEEAGIAFAVTELLEGATLRARVQRGPVSWREAAQIGAAIGEGLGAAHAKGIVHRDVKPENVFLTQGGHVKVLDFGLARLKSLPASTGDSTASVLTQPGTIMGTIGYMAPEQLRGEPETPATDVFALGCVLCEMVCGRAPFARSTPAECIAAVMVDEPADSAPRAPRGVPPEYMRLVRRCLARDPAQRPQTAGEVALALRGMLDTPRVGAAGSVRRAALWASAGVVLAVAAALAADVGGVREELSLLGREPIGSLAVLPLKNLSGDPQQEFLADGLTEAVIEDLAMLPDVRVIERGSVMRFKGKTDPVPEIARQLGVQAVVQATVQRSGGRILISARMVDAATERQLWAQSYDRDARHVLAVQREISQAIARGIKARLTAEQKTRLAEAPPVDPQMHETFLKGAFQCMRGGTQQQGIDLLEAVIARDPTYAPAYAALGSCYHFDAFFYERTPAAEAYGRAKAAALEAVRLEPDMGQAHAVLAQARLHHDWDFAGAERGFRRALELNPGSGEIHHWYAHYLLAMGRADESVAETRRSLELNPLNSGLAACVGWHCFFARQYDEAVASTKRALELDPKSHVGHFYLAWAYEKKGEFEAGIAALKQAIAINARPAGLASLVRLYARAGRRAEAEKVLAELVAMSKARHVPAYDMAVAYAGLGDRDRAFEWLGRACDEKSAMIVHVNWDPRFEELRSDSRFPGIVRRVGLPS